MRANDVSGRRMLIAERTLEARSPDGLVEVTLRIYKPRKESEDWWECRYELSGDASYASTALGADSLQALHLAMKLARDRVLSLEKTTTLDGFIWETGLKELWTVDVGQWRLPTEWSDFGPIIAEEVSEPDQHGEGELSFFLNRTVTDAEVHAWALEPRTQRVLGSVSIDGAPALTDRVWPALLPCRHLRHLRVATCPGIQGAGIGSLSSLESVDMFQSPIVPRAFGRIAELPRLRSLRVMYTLEDIHSLETIHYADSLEVLVVEELQPIDDRVLDAISSCSRLVVLWLFSELSVSSLAPLRQLEALQSLFLHRSTPEEMIHDLRRHAPHLEITVP